MSRRLLLLVLAIGLALVGTFAVYSYARNADQRAVAKTHSAQVLVALKSVPAGTSWSSVLKGKYLELQNVPVESAPSSAVVGLRAPIPGAQVATADIPAGQIVLRPAFAEKQATTGILAIPPGKIAVSVSLASNADVSGFVQNGSEVAIFATFKAKGTAVYGDNQQGTFVTKTLLARVGVIAASQAAPGSVNGAGATAGSLPSSATTSVLVTLALSQQEAERLILAQQVGQLYLGLLSSTSVTAPDGGMNNLGAYSPAPIFVK